MKLKAYTGWSWEALCLLVYLTLAWTQLFVRPIVGMANNGDFPKVLGTHNVCDASGLFSRGYVSPRYAIDPSCYWDSRLPSSESVFVSLVTLSAEWQGKKDFGIGGVGKAHLAVMLGALMILLWALHDASPFLRFGLPPLAILIFSDVLYVSYLNSFYMDAASMVFLLLTVALAAAWVLRHTSLRHTTLRPHTWIAGAFGVAGVLFGLSKTQHVVTAFFLAGLAAWYAARAFLSRDRESVGHRQAWYWTASAAAVALAASATIAMTPNGYKAEPLYSVIFFRMAPELPDRAAALKELGLPDSDLPYFGTHAYSSHAAIASLPWRIAFNNRMSYPRLAGYYLRHPPLVLRLVRKGLKEDVPAMRPLDLANYLREDGFPPATLAHRFDWWSYSRSWLMWVFPAYIVIFYGVMGVGSLLCIFRPPWAARWPQYPLVLVLASSGAVEFLFAVLLDGTEMARHLFLFHVITELLNLCALAAVLCAVQCMFSRTAPENLRAADSH